MTIRVERCYKQFRLIDPDGRVESVPNLDGGYWNRDHAKMALDMYQNVYKYKRRNIRFHHVN